MGRLLYLLFINILFDSAISNPHHMASNDRKNEERKIEEDVEGTYRAPICLERARPMKITKSSDRSATKSTATFRSVHLSFQPSYVVYPTKTSVI